MGCGAAFLLLGFVGKLADTLSIKIMMPATLLVRAIFFFITCRMKDPFNDWSFYLVVPMIHVSYYACTIVLIGYIQKMYPKEIRGMLMMV